jgi:hypothetical protein
MHNPTMLSITLFVAAKNVNATPGALQLPYTPKIPQNIEIIPHQKAPAPGVGCAKL